MLKLLRGGLKDVCGQDYAESFYKVAGAWEGPGEETEPRKLGGQEGRRLGDQAQKKSSSSHPHLPQLETGG